MTAEVADEQVERMTGLMFREKLAPDSGMFFVMPRPDQVSFYMKNTKVPLSIAYINNAGLILEIHDLQPGNETPVPSVFKTIAYALEMEQGWFDKNNVLAGDRIRGLACPHRPLTSGKQPPGVGNTIPGYENLPSSSLSPPGCFCWSAVWINTAASRPPDPIGRALFDVLDPSGPVYDSREYVVTRPMPSAPPPGYYERRTVAPVSYSNPIGWTDIGAGATTTGPGTVAVGTNRPRPNAVWYNGRYYTANNRQYYRSGYWR